MMILGRSFIRSDSLDTQLPSYLPEDQPHKCPMAWTWNSVIHVIKPKRLVEMETKWSYWLVWISC